jgi:hypothetical protein
MKKTHLVLGLAAGLALAVACNSSSGPTTLSITGGCSNLGVTFGQHSTVILDGTCDLGAAGQYTISVPGLPVDLGACGPTTVPATVAVWTEGTAALNSTFAGNAQIPCDGGIIDLTQPITLSGAFSYDGGTGIFSDASGTGVVADGGVQAAANGLSFTATLPISGSLTY